MTSLQELLAYLQDNDIRIWAEGDALKYSAPKGTITPDVRDALQHHKPALLAILHRNAVSSREKEPVIGARPRQGILPLSFSQERMWFLHHMEGDQPAYNVFKAARLRGGPLDRDALEQSLTALVRRHEALRTCFPSEGGAPYQRILPPEPQSLPFRDLQGLKRSEQEQQVLAIAREFGVRPFDLMHGPLFRAMLLKLAPEEHVLFLNQHHIVTDGWSLDILFRELGDLYQAFSTGQPNPLQPPALQYADFALWQREWLHHDRLEPLIQTWRSLLEGVPDAIHLNTDHARPPVATYVGDALCFRLEPSLTAKIRELGSQAGTTPFITILAGYAALLHRYSGMDDLVIGAPVANRTRTELEELVGLFVNTLPLRIDLRGDPTFMELLGRVRETLVSAYALQELPFELLVNALDPDRDLSRNPLFQVMFAFQSRPSVPRQMGPFAVDPVHVHLGSSILDINLMIWTEAEEYVCSWEYDSTIFDRATAGQMAEHFQAVLESATAEPSNRLSALPILREAERQVLLEDWNAGPENPTRARPVHVFVEEQAARTPDKAAILDHDTELRYDELNRRANQLAHALRKRGVGPGKLVGILMSRSIECMVAVLGVLKAGGAYVPLDPDYPAERITFMLSDSGAAVVLVDESTQDSLPACSADILLINGGDVFDGESGANPDVELGTHDLAYVMYTSGSTGHPKGVAMGHGALANLIQWQLRRSVVPSGTTLQFTSLSFDVSFQEIFSTWSAGGTLVLLPQDAPRDMEAVIRIMESRGVERLFMPFAALQYLAGAVDAGDGVMLMLKEINTAGEQLHITPEISRLIHRLDGCVLDNQYGPTETHVVSAHRLEGDPEDWPALPPIGRPIDNVQMYILDAALQPVPIGVTGELYVGGCALAEGYHHRPDENSARFLPHPFDDTAGARIYKTGDLARYLRNGEIVFLGRADDQVKLRGYRVEPGEIETVLERMPAVQSCAVTARGGPADTRLVAYIVAADGATIHVDDVKRQLRMSLPDYMIPAAIVQLDELPVTASGKIDRQALPQPSPERLDPDAGQIAPRDELERRLAAVWEHVLGVHPIGVREDFFELGGHSLMAVRLMSGLAEATGIQLPVAAMFQASTIEEQAALLRREGWQDEESALVPIQAGGRKPPLFFVHWAGGNVLIYRDLVNLLPSDRPVYGLQAIGLGGDVRPHTTVEQMAAYYLDEIRSVQTEGPYHLGGASLGGSIAFEMARQLQAKGEEVGLVALFDTIGRPDQSTLPVTQRVELHMHHLQDLPLKGKLHYLLLRTRIRLIRFFYKTWIRSGLPLPRWMWDVKQTTYYAFKAYRPKPFKGEILLFRAEDRGLASAGSQFLGWDAVDGVHVRVVPVPGKHATVLTGPGVRVVADTLRRALGDDEGLDMEAGAL